MRWAFSLLLSCLFTSAAYADNVGVFTSTSGEVQILRGENYLAAAPGVEVAGDDIVETAKDSSAQLDMEDGSVLKLGPETRLALSDYRLDSNRNVVSAAVEVLSGWLRFAVVKLKPEGRYDIRTPVLTIGVRGTEGTIEAGNEQGGLHLNEGVVDVTPVGNDFTTFQPVRVTGGEFIQRVRGQPLAKFPQPPPAFQNRLPPIMQQKLARRAHELKQRGVPPKVIRAITREDAKRFIERHPHMRERLHQRFERLGVSGPSAQRDQVPLRMREEALRQREQQESKPVDPRSVDKAHRQTPDSEARMQRRRQLREEWVREHGSQTRPDEERIPARDAGTMPKRPVDKAQGDDDGSDERQQPRHNLNR